MKKAILIFTVTLGFLTQANAQVVDDRLITQHLNVNSTQPTFTTFITGFREGFDKARSGAFSSMDHIATHYGIDIRNLPTLTAQLNNPGAAATVFSPVFIAKLKSVEDRADQFQNIRQLRNDFENIAREGNLSQKEAEALALIDITTQEFEKKVMESGISLQEVNSIAGKGGSVVQIDEYFVRWLRCILGTLGSVITGTLNGIATGTTIGGMVGVVGAALGGTIGGIIGFVSGTVNGIRRYCND